MLHQLIRLLKKLLFDNNFFYFVNKKMAFIKMIEHFISSKPLKISNLENES